MKERRITPGPWKWVEDDGDWYLIEAFNRDSQKYPSLGCIISDGSACGEYIPDIEMDNPDAKLIEAAPLMLEALENLENDDESIPAHAWAMIQDAIRAAKGFA